MHLQWYLYAYLAVRRHHRRGWWLSRTEDRIPGTKNRVSSALRAGASSCSSVLNIEIADFYAVGPSICSSSGAGVYQDLTYTIGWLVFGMALLAACIYLHNKPAGSRRSPDHADDVQVFLYD